jgi:hypothetical protein
MQTSVGRQSEFAWQLRGLQHGCTHLLLPAVVLIQRQSFCVFMHCLSQWVPRGGHIGAA